MITGDLKSKIDTIWNTFHANGIAEPFTVIQQITYLIFLKRLDEEQSLKEKKALRLGKAIDKPIYREDQSEIRWSTFKNFDPQTILEVFTKTTEERPITAFEFMKNVGGENAEISRYFERATLANFSPYLLDRVIQQIDGLDMHDKDTKGDLYEYLLSKLASAGTMGQFRTPRHIIRMMIDMLAPQPNDTVCDPSLGTAGFLVMVEEYLRENHPDEFYKEEFQKHLSERMFTGLEFSSDMMQIAAMNLILHGIEKPNLMRVNALSDDNPIKEEFSLILANPPFNGSLDNDQVSKNILSVTKTRDTEVLFITLMLRMLKTGGRCAVIVPQGLVFKTNKVYKIIRKELVDRHHLQAVISMPSGVFKPYAGVSTSVLIFTKTNSGGTGKVWFYNMEADGYSLDDKRNKIEQDDIPDILSRWKGLKEEELRARTEKSFFVPVEEIRANDYDLSINKYKEMDYEEVAYDHPKDIIRAIKALQAENQQDLEALEGLLG